MQCLQLISVLDKLISGGTALTSDNGTDNKQRDVTNRATIFYL